VEKSRIRPGCCRPQDTHLMSKGNDLEFQGGTATNAEVERRNQGGKNRYHAHDDIAMA
jgi:hypothetical protein